MADKILYALILITLIEIAAAPNPFCSVICRSTGCNGNLPTDCNSRCNSNWVANGSTCTPNAAAHWYQVDSIPALGGTMTVTAAGPSTCGPFTVEGWYNPANNVSIMTNGFTQGYYQLTIYVSIIVVDAWDSWNVGGNGNPSSIFTLNFLGVSSTTMKLSSKVAS